MTEQEEEQRDYEGFQETLNLIARRQLWFGLLIVFLLLLSQYCTAQIVPVVTIEQQYSNGWRTGFGAGVENWKGDKAELFGYRNGFAINASIQVNKIILFEVQNMSLKAGEYRNSTVALLAGAGKYGFRFRAGGILGQNGNDISPIVKASYSVKLWKL